MNKRYIDKNYVLIAVAVSVTLAVIIAGLITAVVFTARARQNDDNDYAVTIYIDSVSSLNREIDKLVLCKETEPRKKVASSALIAAARCQIALDLTGLDYHSAIARQEFFNDAIAVLSGDDATVAQYAASLKSACAQLLWSGLGGEFAYTSILQQHNAARDEIEEGDSGEREKTALQAVQNRLNASGEIIGDYGGKIRLEITRNDSSGYAVVDDGGRVCEFALFGTDENNPEENSIGTQRAVEIAKDCGYSQMRVYEVETIGEDGEGITVKLCKDFDGALLIDECVTVSLSSNHTALRAADECKHSKLDVSVSEKQAREYMGCDECGVLVIHRHNGEDRLCYEYVLKADSGSRRVYVCAQNGKQIGVE